MSSFDDGFDWVEARSKCNIKDLWERLRDVVAANVDSAKQHISDQVEFDNRTPVQFVVRLNGEWRTFFLTKETTIDVYDADGMRYRARPSLINADCHLEVEVHDRPDNRQMRLWQFSRLALEPLLFNGR